MFIFVYEPTLDESWDEIPWNELVYKYWLILIFIILFTRVYSFLHAIYTGYAMRERQKTFTFLFGYFPHEIYLTL